MKTDILIIGSGIAGLTFALKSASLYPNKKITILTKSDMQDSNTKYAQGGVAVVLDELDSFEQHYNDTIRAGRGKCDERIVRMVVEEAPHWLNEMKQWGVDFDKTSSGEYDLAMEGGHSKSRVLHHKDITGLEIEKKLIAQIKTNSRIEVFEHCFIIDLITNHHTKSNSGSLGCYGAYVLFPDSEIKTVLSQVTLLATGGLGQVYSSTTNPKIATGDGVAMAHRAGGRIQDLQYIQFHPTSLYDRDETASFLISEAVRGAGAVLRNKEGIRFMPFYDDRADLATRDIVSEAIDTELKKSGDDFVWLDCTAIDAETFKTHFPNILSRCLEMGISPEKDWIPVVPAAHYSCGGVAVDEKGKTNINNLYAVGECARTGLHGANRLASNSLLEALVFAGKSAQDIGTILLKNTPSPHVFDWDSTRTRKPEELVVLSHNRKEVKRLMSGYVGIKRSRERLENALSRIHLIQADVENLYQRSTLTPEICELRNMVTCAKLIVMDALSNN